MTLSVRVGEICAGYGGIVLGLRLAGVDVDLRWLAEVDPALDPLHGTTPNLGDITRVDWSTVEPVDLLTAGFPCQPVSAAGRQLGERDPRWLWPWVADALRTLRPRRFLLENVRNLVSIQRGALWAGILDDLEGLGYGVRWCTLGACHVGAAHHRHRVFALATLGADNVIERVPMSFCGAKGGTVLPTPQARDGDGRGEGDAAYWAARGERRTNGAPLGAVLALLPTPRAGDAELGMTYHNNRGEPGAIGAAVMELLPTPRATDGVNGGPSQRGRRGDLAMPSAVQPANWGRYAEAVARHEALYGPAPAPTEPNKHGAPRLAPGFAEWLMCLPAGHVTAKLPRVAALKAIGNGVCPPQLALAWELLTGMTVVDMSLGRPVASGAMTTTREIKEIQDRNADGRKRVMDATWMADRAFAERNENDQYSVTLAIKAAFMELAACWREEAVIWEKGTKRGRAGTARALREAASRVAGFAVNLTSDAPPYKYAKSLAALGPDSPTRKIYEGVGGAGAMFPGEWGYIEAEHGRPVAPCFECLQGNEDPLPWCECESDETCKGPCRQRAHLPEFHPKTRASSGVDHGAPHVELSDEARGIAARLAAPIVDPLMDYLTGAAPTYEPVRTEQVLDTLKTEMPDVTADLPSAMARIDNPFTSPQAPTRRAPVAAIPFGALPGLISHMNSSAPRGHVSHSYVSSYEGCSLSAVLSDASCAKAIGARRPGWSLIGGNAFHSAVEVVERTVLLGSDLNPTEDMWLFAFDAQIKATLDDLVGTPYADASTWHVANGGREGMDWWRVEGAAMLARYVKHHDATWRATHKILQINGTPVIEYPYEMTVRTLDGTTGVTAKGFIDQAWLNVDTGMITVTDMKSGRSEPASVFQLAEYAHALAMELMPNDPTTMGGRFWLARKGIYTDAVDVLTRHPLEELQFRYGQAMRGTQAGIFVPNVTNLCVSCGVRDYCPVGSKS